MPSPAQSGAAFARPGQYAAPHLAIANINASNYYATAISGGEAGVSTGFFEACLCMLDAASFAAIQMFAQRMNNSNQGHQLYATAAGGLIGGMADGGGTFRSSPTRQLTLADVGKLHVVLLEHDGTFLRLWVDRVQAGTGTALVGFTPSANAHALGYGFGLFSDKVPPLAMLTGRGVMSDAQRVALFEHARATGDLPKALTSMPVILGARGFGTGHYLSTPGGVRGGAQVWVAEWGAISSLSGTEALISTTANSAGGYVIQREGNRLAVGRRSVGTYEQVLTYTFQESDIGRRMLFGLSHDGTTLRGWVDGVEVGSLACAPIMAPTAAPMSIGTSWNAYPTQLIPAPNFTALGVVGGDGSVLTAGEWTTLNADTVANGAIGTVAGKATHRWDIRGAIVANGGIMPASVPDTIGTDHLTVTGTIVASATGAVATHHWSLKRALAGTTVTDGQAAPASIADTVTAAPADAFAKVGSPTVRKIWRSANGKKRDGVLGHTNTSYYQSAPGAGIRGAPGGFWFFLAPRIDSISVAGNDAYQGVCGAMAANQATGYVLWFDGNNLRFGVGNGGGSLHTPTLAFVAAAADVGQRVPILCRLNGSTAELWVRGVAVGTTNVTIGYSPAGITVPMELGRVSLTTPAVFNSSKLTHYGLMGGDVAISNAEVAAVFAEFAATERMIGPAGKTQHYYDIPRDSLLSGGTEAPAQVLDRAGTDHLSRVGGLVVSGGALTNFGASGYPQGVSVATGLPGTAGALWVEALVVAPATGLGQTIFSNTGLSANGLQLTIVGNNVAQAIFGNNTTTFTASSSSALTPGQTYHLLARYDGSVATLWVNGVSGTATAAFTLTPGSHMTKLGTLYAGTSQPATSAIIRGVSGGHVVPTSGEIAAASSYALANGKVGGIAGKTLRLYSIVDDVAEAGGKVPGLIKDRVSNSEHLSIVGAPLQLSRRTDYLYALDRDHLGRAKPIETGLKNFTTSSVLRTANGGGTAGSYAGGIWWAGLFKYLSTTGVSGSIIGKCGISTLNGYEFYMSGGTLLFVRVVGTNDWINGPILTFTAADIGKLFFIGGWIDPIAGSLRGFARRAQIGSGVACTAYQVPTTRPFFIGGRTEAAGGTIQNAVPNFASYGAMCGQGVPSIAEWQYAHDASVAGEEIVALPGARTEHLWNIKRDYIEAGNAMPTQILDRIGTDHMSIAGTDLTIEHQYARLWAA
jgi:hypothetical protein